MNPAARHAVVAVLAFPLGACAPAPAAPLAITLRGSVNLGATATDQNGQAFTVTGMSGITWLGASPAGGGAQRFAAVMDNSSRVVLIDAVFNADGSMASAAIARGLTLSESRDFEGISLGPACASTFIISDETAGPPASPLLREFDRAAGTLVRTIDAPPAVFTNARSNFGFESLTRTPSGAALWSANEEALTIDGPVSSPTGGTVVRLLRWRVSGGAISPVRQFAYQTQPMHGAAITSGRSGLVDLVALPDGRLIAMERSFALAAQFFQSRIYELDLTGATEISGFASGLIGQSYTPVSKRLLWSGSVANMEGLTLGPPLGAPGSGRAVLLGVVDDADPVSLNTLVAFELSGLEAPREDANADGAVNVEDVHRWHALPSDVNRDGVSTTDDRVALTDALRAPEPCGGPAR